MDAPVVYADLNLLRGSEPRNSSPLPLPQGHLTFRKDHEVPSPHDACQCPSWHKLALKLGCAGLILLVLSIIGWSSSVIFLIQRSSIDKSTVDVLENWNETTERPVLSKCPIYWHLLRNKCLFLHHTYQPWNDSLTECSTRKSHLLIIQDQEELRLVQDLLKNKTNQFWIGLKYSLSEKTWKWTNGSVLNSDIFQITGEAKENSCVLISQTKVYPEDCIADNYWICQKNLKSVIN